MAMGNPSPTSTMYTLMHTEPGDNVTESGEDAIINDGDVTGWVWIMEWTWTNMLQLLFSLIGILGNLLVILALSGRKTTRYSVDIFIGALAVADFLTSVIMIPLPKAQVVPKTVLGTLYCKVVFNSFLMRMFVFSSSYILVGMSVERLVVVAFPLHRHRLITKLRVYVFLMAVCVLSVPASGHALTVEVIGNRCRDTKSATLRVKLTIYLFVVRIGLPVLIMISTQILIVISLHRQHKNLQDVLKTSKDATPTFHAKARNSIVKMTAIIVTIFILSIGPHNLAIMITGVRGTLSSYFFSPLYYTLNVLPFINSSANPFIYAARFPKFRKAIKSIFTRGVSKTRMPLFDPDVENSQSNSLQATNASSVQTISQDM